MAQVQSAPVLKGPVRVGDLSKPRPLRRQIGRQTTGGEEQKTSGKNESQPSTASFNSGKNRSSPGVTCRPSGTERDEMERRPAATDTIAASCSATQDEPKGSGPSGDEPGHAHSGSKGPGVYGDDFRTVSQAEKSATTSQLVFDSGESNAILSQIQELRRVVAPPPGIRRQLSAPTVCSSNNDYDGKVSAGSIERPASSPAELLAVHRRNSSEDLRSRVRDAFYEQTGLGSQGHSVPVVIREKHTFATGDAGGESGRPLSDALDQNGRDDSQSPPSSGQGMALSSTPQSTDEDSSRLRLNSSSMDELLGSSITGDSTTQSTSMSSFNTSGEKQEMKFVKCSVTGMDGQQKDVTIMSTDIATLTVILCQLQKDMSVDVVKMSKGTEDLMHEMGRQLGVSLTATELQGPPPGGRYSVQELVDIASHPLSHRQPYKWDRLAQKHPGICLTEVHQFFQPSDYHKPSS